MLNAARVRPGAVALVIVLAGGLAPQPARASQGPPSSAADPTTTTATIPGTTTTAPPPLKDQVVEVSAEEAQLLDQMDASNSHLQTLSARIADLDQQIATAQRDLDVAQGSLDRFESHQWVLEARLADTTAQLAEAKAELERRAVAAYISAPTADTYADLLLHVRSMRELAATSGYVTAVIDEQARAVHRYRDLRSQAKHLRDAAESTRAQAQAERDVVAGKTATLRDERRTSDLLIQQVGSEQTTASQIMGLLLANKGTFEAEIRALQQESNAIEVILRQRQDGEATVAAGHGVLALPVPGAPLTSPFGPRIDPIFHDVRFHTGIDLGAPAGTPIHAAADGIVVSAGPLGGYGNATVIDHGQALATLYAHQSLVIVKAGDRIARGEVIGFVGCTGICTGPHLHFEVRVTGTPVNPLLYL